MANIGTLTIEMAANIARLKTDMDAARRTVDGAMLSIQKSVDAAKNTIVALASTAGLGMFVSLVKSSINAAAALHDLSTTTGASVESLSALASIGKLSDVSVQQIAGSMNKLAKNMAGATEESKGTGKALEALGINFASFAKLNPQDQMIAIAKAMNQFEDGGGKAAVAMSLLGKEGAAMLPFLKDLAESGHLAAKVTTEQAAAADNFQDNLTRLQASASGLVTEISMGMIPALSDASNAFVKVMNETGGMRDVFKKLAADGSIRSFTQGAIIGLTYVIDVVEALFRVIHDLYLRTKADFMQLDAIFGGFAESVRLAVEGKFGDAADALGKGFTDASTIAIKAAAEVKEAWDRPLFGSKIRDAMSEINAIGPVAENAKKSLNFTNVLNDNTKEAEKFSASIQSLMSKISGKDNGLDSDFFKNINLLFQGYKKGKITLDDYIASVETYITQQKFHTEATQAQIKEYEELAEAEEKQRESIVKIIEEDAKLLIEKQKIIKSSKDLVENLEFEIAAMEMENTQREIAIKLRELESTGIDKTSEAYQNYAERIRKAQISKDGIEQSIKEQEKYAKDWEKITDQIGDALTKNLMEGGKNAFTYIKDLFRTLVLRPILDPIMKAGAGMIAGALGLSVPGTASANDGGATSTINLLTVINNGYEFLKEGFASMTGQLGSQIRDTADFFIQSSNQTVSEFGQALYSNSESLANAAGALGNAAAAYGIQKFLSGGYKIGDGVVVDVLTAVGGAIFGPIAGVVGGIVNRLFGDKLAAAGIKGNFGGDVGFAGNNYEFYQGGFFSFDSTKLKKLDDTVQRALASQFLAIQGSMLSMANALGGVANEVNSYTKAIKVNLMGLSKEKAQEKLSQVFIDITEEMATSVLRGLSIQELEANNVDLKLYRKSGGLGFKKVAIPFFLDEKKIAEYLEQFERVGETSADTLKRLSIAISLVNQSFDSLGYTLLNASLAGSDLASKITEAFGGVEQFTKSINDYYQEFYSQTERTETLTRQLTETFTNMGLTLPLTREAYRALVETQDLTTESGRALFAMLINLSPTFASVTLRAEELAGVVDDLGGVVDDLGNTAVASAEALRERASLNRQLLSLQGDTTKLRELDRVALFETNRELQDTIWALEDAQVVAAKAAEVLNEKNSLEMRYLVLQGKTTEIRDLERAALDSTNQALQDRIWALEDLNAAEIAAEEILREVAAKAAEVLNEKTDLENQLFNLLGSTTELRKRELETLDSSNQALQQRIWALGDARDATDAAMAAVERSIEAASAAAEKAITDKYEALNATLEAQREAANVARDLANQNIESIKSVFEYLKRQIQDLIESSGAGMTSAQGLSFIDQAIVSAKATGYLPEQEGLQAAVQAARSGLESSNYATSFEMRKDSLMLAGKLAELQNLAGGQMSIAEKQLAAAELLVDKTNAIIEAARVQFEKDIAANIAYYDAMLLKEQTQIDVLRGVNSSVLGVSAAISSLASAVASERAAAAAAATAAAATGLASSASTSGTASVSSKEFTSSTMLAAAKALYYSTHGGYSSSLYNAAVFPFGGGQQAFSALGWDGSTESAAAIRKQYGFASGGLHEGGMRIVGEQGPELEVTGPARYYSASNTADMLGANVSEELFNLRIDNQAQTKSLASLQARMTRVIERWDGNGLPATRVETA